MCSQGGFKVEYNIIIIRMKSKIMVLYNTKFVLLLFGRY